MAPVHDLPAGMSAFIGRRAEMAELRRLAGHTRILTILGPGGAGKTRLATEFARHREARFADGVLIVELADVRDPTMVANAVARAAGLTPRGLDTLAAVVRRLADRQTLVLFDNCEHLVDAAAEVAAALLRDCPRLSILATSRERLNIDGETTYRLPPMQLPATFRDPGEAAVTDGVQLFVDRARSARPGFDIDAANGPSVVAICRGLDGMPLAIELAAARVATLSTGEIMARLDDRLRLLVGGHRNADSRQQTLRATVDWSYDLLDDAERTVLQRLSVFAGGFALDAAEDVAGFDPIDAASVIEIVRRLADKSVIQVEVGRDEVSRYRLLQTIREYAAAKLAETGGESEVRDRHLAFFSRLADRAFEARMVRGALPEHRRLWSDMADVRVALEYAHADPDSEVALLGNLRYIWTMYAPAEGLVRLNQILPLVEHKPNSGLVRAHWVWHALNGRSGHQRETMIQPADLGRLAEEAGEVALAPVEMLGTAYVAERVERNLDKARAALEAAVTQLQAIGARPDLAMAMASLGGVEMQLGNLDAARERIDRALQVAVEAEDDYGRIGVLYTRGWLEILGGDARASRRDFMAALDLAEESDLLSMAQQVEGIASTVEEARAAVTLFGASDKLREELDSPLALPWSRWIEPAIAKARARLSREDDASAWDAGRSMSLAALLAAARSAGGAGPGSGEPMLKGAGGLSRRELEVARLVAGGSSNREIAQRLFLSERTVESHIDHILGKLNFKSRTQVAGWISKQG